MIVARLVFALLIVTAGLTACAASEEDRCKRDGGTWRQTFCETQAK